MPSDTPILLGFLFKVNVQNLFHCTKFKVGVFDTF